MGSLISLKLPVQWRAPRMSKELAFPLVGIERGYFLDVQHFFGDKKLVGFKVLCSPCNMKCYYCHRSPFLNRNVKWLSIDELFKKMKEWEPYNIVTLTGGEVTLVTEVSAEIMDRLRSKGITVLFSTNGLLTGNVDLLTKHADLVKIDVKASRRLYKKVTGVQCYDQVLESVAICTSRLNTEVKIILHSFTKDKEIEEIIKDLYDVTGFPENMIIEFQLIKDFLNRGIREPNFEEMKKICSKIKPLPSVVLLKSYTEREVVLKLVGNEWIIYKEKEIPLRFNW
jgi:pyruvate-formate lyase-activating enzyme